MWLLNLIPTAILDVIVNLVLVAGLGAIIASFLVRTVFFPFQKIITQAIGITLLVLGVYWKGGLAIEKEWRAKLEAAERRAEIAEEKAANATAKIEYVFKDKVVKVKEVQVIIKDSISKAADEIDKECTITDKTISILNDAARNSIGEKK